MLQKGGNIIILVPAFQGLYNGFDKQLDHQRRCLLYTSDAADERSSVDLGGRRIIKKKNIVDVARCRVYIYKQTEKDNKEY